MKFFNTLVLVATVFAPHAFGSSKSFIEKIKSKMGSDHQFSMSAAASKKVVNNCVNFTGHWVGTCVDQDGNISDEELRIQQEDCYSITFDGYPTVIGGTTAVSIAPNIHQDLYVPASAQISHAWNASQTRLNTMVTGTIFHGWGLMYTSQQWLQGGKLHTKDLESRNLKIDNTPTWEKVDEECVYEKQ